MGVKDNYIYEKCKNALDANFGIEPEICSEKGGVKPSQECKSFYKNKFRCRMFVPIDDNYLQRTYNRVSRERTRKNDAKATEENSERS